MILALDISLANTGYCKMAIAKKIGFGVNNNKQIIAVDSIPTSKNDEQAKRIKDLQFKLMEIINDEEITEIICEDTYLFKNPKTKQLLDRLAGMVISLCNIYEKPYRFITTMTLKAHILQQPITQPRKTKDNPNPVKIDYKKLMQDKIIQDYNLNAETNNDKTDAIGLAICGLDGIHDKIKEPKKKVKKDGPKRTKKDRKI